MRDFDTEYRAITHPQIELLASRVSAINQWAPLRIRDLTEDD